jgi:syntaxin 16
MASRNLTRRYIEIRNNHKANRNLNLYSSDEGEEDSAHRSLLSSSRDRTDSASSSSADPAADWRRTLQRNLPPIWVDLVEEIEECVVNIQGNMRSLTRLHAQRLMVNFESDETEQEHEIDTTTREITSQFRRAEGILKKFGHMGDEATLSRDETVVRSNMKRSIAKKLQGLSAAFRQSQKDYLKRMSAQKAGCKFDSQELDFLSGNSNGPKALSDIEAGVNMDFTEAQLAELEDTEQLVNQRDGEITKIAQSIEELANIFKELAVLVIDQGTVLDRIDYNMEMVVDRTREGITQLTQAEESQKSARPLRCLIILVILNILMCIVLYYKWRRELYGK